VGAVKRSQQGWARAHGSLCERGGGKARDLAFDAVHSRDTQATPAVAQWQVQLGLRGRGRGEVHGGNVPGGLEDVGGRCLDRGVDVAPFRVHWAGACHVHEPRDEGACVRACFDLSFWCLYIAYEAVSRGRHRGWHAAMGGILGLACWMMKSFSRRFAHQYCSGEHNFYDAAWHVENELMFSSMDNV
jgi:hypothetical protein